eukprot:gb/GECG01015687.1/.p1 GENE.gb/GECG01015687.1/~~gb/GECG01015687.1/.p1  ORF type:complete len:563 (+),score=59.30 gb/GECG01015687.1/:1-1689(+)
MQSSPYNARSTSMRKLERTLTELRPRYSPPLDEKLYWDEVARAFELSLSLKPLYGGSVHTKKTERSACNDDKERYDSFVERTPRSELHALRVTADAGSPNLNEDNQEEGIRKTDDIGDHIPECDGKSNEHLPENVSFEEAGVLYSCSSDERVENNDGVRHENVENRQHHSSQLATSPVSSVPSPIEAQDTDVSSVSSAKENVDCEEDRDAQYDKEVHEWPNSTGRGTSFFIQRYDYFPLSTVSFVAKEHGHTEGMCFEPRHVEYSLLSFHRRRGCDFEEDSVRNLFEFLYERFREETWNRNHFDQVPSVSVSNSAGVQNHACPGGLVKRTADVVPITFVSDLIGWQINARQIINNWPSSSVNHEPGLFEILGRLASPLLLVTTPKKMRVWYEYLSKDPTVSIYKHCGDTKRPWAPYCKRGNVGASISFLKRSTDPRHITSTMQRSLRCNVVITTFASLESNECQLTKGTSSWNHGEGIPQRTSSIYQVLWDMLIVDDASNLHTDRNFEKVRLLPSKLKWCMLDSKTSAKSKRYQRACQLVQSSTLVDSSQEKDVDVDLFEIS